MAVRTLSGFTTFIAHLEQHWQSFQDHRSKLLTQEARYGTAPEKIAEDILKNFFSMGLDWPLENINNQVGFADMVLTHQGIKRLIVEVKRPGSLSWNKQSLSRALTQARQYAEQQRVTTVAVSDGDLFYAADIQNGGLVDRLSVQLASATAIPDLYWVSVDGIYRPIEQLTPGTKKELPVTGKLPGHTMVDDISVVLHPKHNTPSWCFGYVADASKPRTWKLPYRLRDGRPDEKHLPGAIRAVLTNYRGAHNTSVPEQAIPDVLVRLGVAAWEAGKMPGQVTKPLASYQLLHDALFQLDRLDEIKS